jgi:hypothetical protein
MATWDDHDYAYDNAGNEYACPMESQEKNVDFVVMRRRYFFAQKYKVIF